MSFIFSSMRSRSVCRIFFRSVPKRLHSSLVVRDRMVLVIAANHPLEPLPNVLHLLVYALAQRLPHLLPICAETSSFVPRCPGPHGIGNSREPPFGATPQCPSSSRLCARAASAESSSAWPSFACRSSSGTPESTPSCDSSHRCE